MTNHDSETPAKGQQVITACAFIYRMSSGRIELFMPRRAMTKKFLPGMFELPGGHIDFGETLEEGLRREIKEEFNQDIIIVDPFYAFTYLNEAKGAHAVEVIYFAKFGFDTEEVTIKLNPEDHSEYLWINEDGLDKIINVNKSDSDPEILAIKKGFKILNTRYGL